MGESPLERLVHRRGAAEVPVGDPDEAPGLCQPELVLVLGEDRSRPLGRADRARRLRFRVGVEGEKCGFDRDPRLQAAVVDDRGDLDRFAEDFSRGSGLA